MSGLSPFPLKLFYANFLIENVSNALINNGSSQIRPTTPDTPIVVDAGTIHFVYRASYRLANSWATSFRTTGFLFLGVLTLYISRAE